MRAFWVVLPLTFAFLFAAVPVALCQSRAAGPVPGVPPYMVAAITVNVTAPPAQAGPRSASGGSPEIKLVNGKPLMRLTAEANGQTIEAPEGTYILLRFSAESGALGFTVSPPGILEAPKGIYHLPEGAIGMLRATHTGTARVVVQGIQPRPARRGIFNSTSPSWSGYGTKGGPGAFVKVTGEWTVPTVSGDGGDHSATWIGIDGFGNDNLIQVGTEQDYSSGVFGGGPEYYAWWECSRPNTSRFRIRSPLETT